ncbi:hypothetical protein F2Q69_00058905 [Brassica cretica]|uniref:Uncharacterized protein n=1 Tax=Brassica cretica TaxID=69181 RepID=A0A8S9RGZ6_BRACR|nr:hypothetical protein F2Q69_00058905 [Brassica cretica]
MESNKRPFGELDCQTCELDRTPHPTRRTGELDRPRRPTHPFGESDQLLLPWTGPYAFPPSLDKSIPRFVSIEATVGTLQQEPRRLVFPNKGKGAILGPDPENSIAGNQGVPSSGDPGNRGSFQRGSRGRCLAWLLEVGPCSSNPEIPGSTQDGEHWASDDVFEMVEP